VAEQIADLAKTPAHLRGGVVAIGNFDGVHRGHQSVLALALEIAAKEGLKAHILTFEPHPRTVFKPQAPVFRLTPPALKANIAGLMGFSAVFEQRFSRGFAASSADKFIDHILVRDLRVAHVVTGFNFHFGNGREGDTKMLAKTGSDKGFGVTEVAAMNDEGGETISSSRIRKMLSTGDVAHAAGLLGYRYSVTAEIVHGKKLGRTLGFPTANMVLPPEAELMPGIYAVRLRRGDGTLHDGVASFGRRPTVDAADAPLLLETYVFDAEPDLYGETCTVSLFGFLRAESKFDGLESLTRQMKQDEAEARALLTGVTPLSDLDRQIAF